jgi:hypothetical protein
MVMYVSCRRWLSVPRGPIALGTRFCRLTRFFRSIVNVEWRTTFLYPANKEKCENNPDWPTSAAELDWSLVKVASRIRRWYGHSTVIRHKGDSWHRQWEAVCSRSREALRELWRIWWSDCHLAPASVCQRYELSVSQQNRVCLSATIAAFLDFVHRPELQIVLENTTFGNWVCFRPPGEGRHLLCWVS